MSKRIRKVIREMKFDNKGFKKALLTFAVAGAFVMPASADSWTIKREKLPEPAQEMLTTYFPKAKVSSIKIDKHLLKKTDYDVKLTNGTKIEFDNGGKWTSVDCKKKEVPSELVPTVVKNYMKKNLSDQTIVAVKKNTLSYEIRLADGRELKFNLLGQLQKSSTTDEELASDDAAAEDVV